MPPPRATLAQELDTGRFRRPARASPRNRAGRDGRRRPARRGAAPAARDRSIRRASRGFPGPGTDRSRSPGRSASAVRRRARPPTVRRAWPSPTVRGPGRTPAGNVGTAPPTRRPADRPRIGNTSRFPSSPAPHLIVSDPVSTRMIQVSSGGVTARTGVPDSARFRAATIFTQSRWESTDHRQRPLGASPRVRSLGSSIDPSDSRLLKTPRDRCPPVSGTRQHPAKLLILFKPYKTIYLI